MSDEQKNGEPPESVGAGGNFTGVTKEDRMEQRAIRQRWPIPEECRKPIINRVISRLNDSEISDRDFNQTFNALLKAEAQNQADEHKQQPDEVNINLTGGVRIVEDDNWYGNADRFASIAAAASGSDSDRPVPVQGGSRRPPVGKNGDGTASNS